MTLSGDDIIEASLLKPTKEECGTSPTPEEEAILLGKYVGPPDVPGSLPECPEFSKLAEPTEQTDALSTSPPPSPVPQLSFHPSSKAKKPQREIGADLSHAGKWVCSYLQMNERVPKLWREFRSILHPKDEHFSNVQIKGMAQRDAVAFRVPATQQGKDSSWTTPFLKLLGWKDYFP